MLTTKAIPFASQTKWKEDEGLGSVLGWASQACRACQACCFRKL